MIPDLINAFFEAAGGIMSWVNVYTLYQHKVVRGINVWSTVFFTSWSVWNLWYYPHLGQWASFWGGLVIGSANLSWVVLAIYYRKR